MRRARIFRQPPPTNWHPLHGEPVYVASLAKTLRRVRAIGMVIGRSLLDEREYVVLLRRGTCSREFVLPLEELRPAK